MSKTFIFCIRIFSVGFTNEQAPLEMDCKVLCTLETFISQKRMDITLPFYAHAIRGALSWTNWYEQGNFSLLYCCLSSERSSNIYCFMLLNQLCQLLFLRNSQENWGSYLYNPGPAYKYAPSLSLCVCVTQTKDATVLNMCIVLCCIYRRCCIYTVHKPQWNVCALLYLFLLFLFFHARTALCVHQFFEHSTTCSIDATQAYITL